MCNNKALLFTDKTKRQQKANEENSASSLTNQTIIITSRADRYFASIPAQAGASEEI